MADSQTGLDDLLVQVQTAIRQDNVAEAVRRIQAASREEQMGLLYALSRTLDPALRLLHIQPMDPDFYAGRDQLRTYGMDLKSALDEARKPGGSAALRAALDLAQTLNRETESLRRDYISQIDLARGLAGVGCTAQTLIQVLSPLANEPPPGASGQ